MNNFTTYPIAIASLLAIFGVPLGTLVNFSQSGDSTGMPGVVKAKQTVVVFPALSGNVKEIRVNEGDFVKAGDVLIVLDDRVAKASWHAADVSAKQTGPLELAQAELHAAQQYWDRLQNLSDPRAVSKRDVEAAQANLSKAKANLLTAEENLDLAKQRLEIEKEKLELHCIRAPFDGQIVNLQLHLGQKVIDDSPLVEITNNSILRTELHLPSNLYRQLKTGEEYWLQPRMEGVEKIAAKLVSISPTLDPGTSTVRCVFEFENLENQLPAGFLVDFDQSASGWALRD